ncbi:hypothetical protein [Desulfuromonas sp. CSMB_57]|jgi:hypothetical protein|uniref:hypothetical protein n=1 Tax=Desulfuromonas sp. CSMB_57 TaxID=2807629 RepID=UPI001CD3C375|nr:hypothetical protein [Desulfuromonas sp. CSMB_57]
MDESSPAPGREEQTAAVDRLTEQFPELEQLRRDIARQIRDNQRFLAGLLEEDDGADGEVDPAEEECCEEL